MGTVADPLSQTVRVSYRSVGNGSNDEEAGMGCHSTRSGGDSIGGSILGSSTTRRMLKPRLIFGRAWGRSVQWLKAHKKGEQAYRMVDREGHFHQSMGRWNIRRLKGRADLKKLIGSDPFHSFLDQSTFKIVVRIFTTYLGIVLVFAIIYTSISATLGCSLKLTSIREGFLFSLETMTTVGYGTHDYLFGRCWIMLPMLSLQACIGLLIDAFLIGILFARISRPQTRANTVVFTKNAVIRRVRGESYFMFQVGELRKHQLLETRVRCYALRHERLNCNPVRNNVNTSGNSWTTGTTADMGGSHGSFSSGIGMSRTSSVGMGSVGGSGARVSSAELAENMPDQVFFQSHRMRLQHPDDELGGDLLLVLPQTIVHRIDAWSPMMPPPRWNSSHGPVQWGLHPAKDVAKAPWEEISSSPDGGETTDAGYAAATTASTAAAAAPTAAADSVGDGSFFPAGAFERRAPASAFSTDGQYSEQDSAESRLGSGSGIRQPLGYWDEASVSEFGLSVHEKCMDDDETDNLGYVHRFPDLLKRWDDVDGDRGTWYEKMKRRLLKVEMERRQAEEMRKRTEKGGKTADEVRAAASRSRLARAGYRRLSSIMHVGGGAAEKQPAEGNEGLDIDRLKETPSLGKLSEEQQAAHEEAESQPFSSSGSGYASLGCGHGGGVRLSAGQWFAREERKAIDAFVQDRELEVVVILEGTDTSTGSTVQARHSYCWEDILWDRTFASCVTRGEDGACEVDFSKFHDTLRAPANCDDHGFIQSYA